MSETIMSGTFQVRLKDRWQIIQKRSHMGGLCLPVEGCGLPGNHGNLVEALATGIHSHNLTVSETSSKFIECSVRKGMRERLTEKMGSPL